MSVDVFILTGFLGSGKTTLLRRILQEDSGHTALIINEFGEIGIDHVLLQSVADDTVLLPNGCLCCTANGDLVEAILNLVKVSKTVGGKPLQRIIIETTGLANPSPVIASVTAASRRTDLQLAGVVTVVDLVHASLQYQSQSEWVQQVTSADVIVLSKMDLVRPQEQSASLELLHRLNPGVSLLHNNELAAVARLFETQIRRHLRPLYLLPTTSSKLGHDSITTASIFIDDTIDWARFSIWIGLMTRRYGDKLLRMKSIFTDETTQQRVAVHAVQYQVYFPDLIDNKAVDAGAQVVLITKGLDPALIERSLLAFLGKTATHLTINVDAAQRRVGHSN